MNKYLIGAMLTALWASTAVADEDPMASFYGNSIVTTIGSATLRTHYRPDHTFDMVGSMMFMKRTFKGTWALDSTGKLCRTYVGAVPPDTTNPTCVLLVPRKVGETWTTKDGKGTATLQAGVQ